MDHHGWYDRKSKEKNFKRVEDIILACAMGPPGGGRSPITQRLQRHYNIVTYTDLQEDTIRLIFGTILKEFMLTFSEEIVTSVEAITNMTLRVYDNVINGPLKPIPRKSHYTFNLRDISKIFQGLCSAHVS